MNSIVLHSDVSIGSVKPMHCTNNIPSLGNDYLLSLMQDVVPFARLHDTFMTVYDRFVDVHNLFPNFDADETDPASYDFTFTDCLLQKMENANIKPFYRLGTSIENYCATKAYNIYPPKDPEKWARICEHIIRHYNEGWADGMHLGIEYWEIWNEPENQPEPELNQMWRGTFEEYIHLYEVAAKHLKSCFSHLKLGGYASCGFYAMLGGGGSPGFANVSPRTEYFLECLEKFLKAVSQKREEVPLDFFSWHSYSDSDANVKYARFIREKLDAYGFTETESILNEWNPGIDYRGTVHDASAIAATMLALQDEKVEMLMYYDARLNTPYCGMFTPIGDAPNARSGKALPAYYTFKAFSELYHLGTEVETLVDGENLYAVSATDGKTVSTMLTNFSDKTKSVSFEGFDRVTEALTLSEGKNLTPTAFDGKAYTLTPYETLLIRQAK